jgi:hypothetical protein
MVTVWNGNPGNRPARRLRFDEYPSKPNRNASQPARDEGVSGRRAVIGGMLAVLVLAGGLALVFRDWRARYRERAAFGARQVATAIDPLAEVVPPVVSRDDWRRTVADTHAMLVTLTGSNLLDLDQMRELRVELTARVARARARPETACAELAALWDDLADRAGPVVVKHHPRPRLLPPRQRSGPRSGPGSGS